MARRFRPPIWAWFAVLPMLALLLSLGTWQLQRGQAKAELMTRMDRASVGDAEVLSSAIAPPRADDYRRVTASGRYDSARQLLLDNQASGGQPGYHVLTPFELTDGSWVLVDRGWVPLELPGSAPQALTVDESARQLDGLWRPLPRPALVFEHDNCEGQGWPRVVQYPRHEELQCLYRNRMLDGIVLLSPQMPDAFVRAWSVGVGVPPMRHYAYAAQWYAFAATLLFLFVKLSIK